MFSRHFFIKNKNSSIGGTVIPENYHHSQDRKKEKSDNLKAVISLRSELMTENEETMMKNDKRDIFLEI